MARDRAMRALIVSVSATLVVCLPLAAVVAGFAVRAFLWAAGLGG